LKNRPGKILPVPAHRDAKSRFLEVFRDPRPAGRMASRLQRKEAAQSQKKVRRTAMANEVKIKLTDEQKARIKEGTGQDLPEIRVSNVGNNPATAPVMASPRAAAKGLAPRQAAKGLAPRQAAKGLAPRQAGKGLAPRQSAKTFSS
jgi:hypothetical protein